MGGVDVVVCDGFSGNVMLKTIEGTAYFMGSLMKHKIFKRNLLSMIGYLFCKKGVKEVLACWTTVRSAAPSSWASASR